jgi:hypothetical protein
MAISEGDTLTLFKTLTPLFVMLLVKDNSFPS